jgi:Sulfotransferase family
MLAAELDPLLLTAPTIRCGTTLLQRLICSSPDALLFGEQAADELATAVQLITARRQMLAGNRADFDASLAAFAAGDSSDWMIDLLPDVDGYLQAIADGYLQPAAYCREFALRAGRRVWGVKYPGWGRDVLQRMMAELPRAKLIVIHRDVAAALRSAKARGSVRRLADAKAICAQWAANMRFASQLPSSPRTLLVAYEDLIRDPEPQLRRIEAFAGIAAIDRGVLAQRVNAWGGYVEPAELSEAEIEVCTSARA